MDTNKLFSFQRIAMVMKRDFFENWKTNLYRFAGMYAAFLVVYVFFLNEWDEMRHLGPVKTYSTAFLNAFIYIVVFFLLWEGSTIMERMRTKEMRTSFLMLPATSLEKFFARSLTVTVGTMLMLVMAMCLAELSHFILMPLFDISDEVKGWVLPEVWARFCKEINPFGTYSLLTFSNGVETIVERSNFYNFIAASSILLWIHSFPILGGNVWYKHAYIKTAIAFLVLFCIIAYVCVEFEPFWLSWARRFEEYLQMLDESHVLCIITAFFLALTCFNWWLAYRLFTRSQVIKPKFRLL